MHKIPTYRFPQDVATQPDLFAISDDERHFPHASSTGRLFYETLTNSYVVSNKNLDPPARYQSHILAGKSRY